MTLNKPMSLLRFAAALAVAVLLAAPASADLTAREAAYRLQAWLDSQGGRLEADSISEEPGEVKLNQVRIDLAKDRQAGSLFLDWLNFVAVDGGGVAIELPDRIVVGFVDGDGSLDHHQLEIPGISGSVSESRTGLSLTLSGPHYQGIGNNQNPLSGHDEQAYFSLRNWRIDAELEERSGKAPLQAAFAAEILEAGISGEDTGSTDFSLDEPRASFAGPMDQLFGGNSDPFGQNPAHTKFSFAAAVAISGDTAGDGPGIGFSTGPSDFGYSTDAGELEFVLQINNMAVLAVVPGNVQHAAQFSDFKVAAVIFERQERGTVEFSLRLAMPEVAVNPELFAVFGAGLELPHDAADLLTGKLVIDSAFEVPRDQARQILNGQQMTFDAPGLVKWRLEELWLEFFGMSLTGHGEIEHLAGMPEPRGNSVRGSLHTEFAGVGQRLDAAAKDGLIPLEMLLYLKALAAMGEEIGDDRLGYVFEFAGENGIFLNGAPIR